MPYKFTNKITTEVAPSKLPSIVTRGKHPVILDTDHGGRQGGHGGINTNDFFFFFFFFFSQSEPWHGGRG
jgi:hypothetical protein